MGKTGGASDSITPAASMQLPVAANPRRPGSYSRPTIRAMATSAPLTATSTLLALDVMRPAAAAAASTTAPGTGLAHGFTHFEDQILPRQRLVLGWTWLEALPCVGVERRAAV